MATPWNNINLGLQSFLSAMEKSRQSAFENALRERFSGREFNLGDLYSGNLSIPLSPDMVPSILQYGYQYGKTGVEAPAQAERDYSAADEYREKAQTERDLRGPRVDTEGAKAGYYRAGSYQRTTSGDVNREKAIRLAETLDAYIQQEQRKVEEYDQKIAVLSARQGVLTAQEQSELQRAMNDRDIAVARIELLGEQASLNRNRAQDVLDTQPARIGEIESRTTENLAQAGGYQAKEEQTRALTPALVQKAQEQARASGAKADQVERLTPVLLDVERAKEQAYQSLESQRTASANLSTAKAETEAELRPLLAQEKEKLIAKVNAQIQQVIAAKDVDETRKQQIIAQMESDAQVALSVIAKNEALAGVYAAEEAYKTALRTDKLPAEVEVMKKQAEVEAERALFYQDQAKKEQAETGQVTQETQLALETHQANLREIDSRITENLEQAKVYILQGGKLKSETKGINLANEFARLNNPQRLAEQGYRTEEAGAKAREATADATVAEETVHERIAEIQARAQEQKWAATEQKAQATQAELLVNLNVTEQDLDNKALQYQLKILGARLDNMVKEGKLTDSRKAAEDARVKSILASVGQILAQTNRTQADTERIRAATNKVAAGSGMQGIDTNDLMDFYVAAYKAQYPNKYDKKKPTLEEFVLQQGPKLVTAFLEQSGQSTPAAQTTGAPAAAPKGPKTVWPPDVKVNLGTQSKQQLLADIQEAGGAKTALETIQKDKKVAETVAKQYGTTAEALLAVLKVLVSKGY